MIKWRVISAKLTSNNILFSGRYRLMKSQSKKIITTDSDYQKISGEEQKIYHHFLELVLRESIDKIIEQFRILFIQCSPYQTPEISTALKRIIQLPQCE